MRLPLGAKPSAVNVNVQKKHNAAKADSNGLPFAAVKRRTIGSTTLLGRGDGDIRAEVWFLQLKRRQQQLDNSIAPTCTAVGTKDEGYPLCTKICESHVGGDDDNTYAPFCGRQCAGKFRSMLKQQPELQMIEQFKVVCVDCGSIRHDRTECHLNSTLPKHATEWDKDVTFPTPSGGHSSQAATAEGGQEDQSDATL